MDFSYTEDQQSLRELTRKILEGEATHERLTAALASLTPEQREAFVLKHVEGRSYEEMSAVLDTPRASLKMRVHRAREALKELLEDFR